MYTLKAKKTVQCSSDPRIVRHLSSESVMSRKQRRAAGSLKQTPTRQPSVPTSAYASSVAEHLKIGTKLHQAGRLAEAEAYYRRVLADQPKHADALNLLGAVAHQTGRHELAIEVIGQAIQQNGENPEYFFNLAGVFYGYGRLDQAVAAYRQAINIKLSDLTLSRLTTTLELRFMNKAGATRRLQHIATRLVSNLAMPKLTTISA
jgi:tetratricopeptide (TPR) repeat protein